MMVQPVSSTVSDLSTTFEPLPINNILTDLSEEVKNAAVAAPVAIVTAG